MQSCKAGSWKSVIALVAVLLMVGFGCKKKEAPSEEPGEGPVEKGKKEPGKEGAKEPVKIGAILAVTGGASLLGKPEENTVKMLEEKINSEGGIDGHKLQVIVKDSAGDAAKALSFAKQLVEEENVFAIVGPTRSGCTLKIKDYCERNKTILMSCAAAEKIVDPVAKYVFKTPQKDSYVVKHIYKVMNDMGISKIGVVAGGTGFGDQGKKQLAKYAGDYGIEILISETYDPKSPDLTALLTKVQEKNVEAVVNWSIVPAQSQVAVNMKQLGFDVPLFQSHGFGNYGYVERAGEAAEGTIFPCGRLLVAEELPDDHPQKATLMEYKTEYEETFGDKVSTFGGHAYDALMILVKAIEKAGLDKEKVRDTIESMTFAGTGGIFKFTPEDHNGLGMDSLAVLTVKNGEFALYKEEE